MRIRSPKELTRRVLRPGDGSQAAKNAVANAETALKQLSINFDHWMASEVAKLLTAREMSKKAGFKGEALEQLFAVAHDLKGQAGTLGYPFAGEVCASLCRLVDARQQGRPTSPLLIDQHVDA
ncbi:MAG: Hpt domain-containing protein, partial [Alphaproteobacteria bacterium]